MSGQDAPNRIDKEFMNLMAYIRDRSLEQVLNAVINNLQDFENRDKANRDATVEYYNKYKMWGEYHPERNESSLIDKRANTLWEHREDFEWLYGRLGDYRSKKVLLNILSYWLAWDFSYIASLQDHYFHQYFDCDLIPEAHDEVVADLGAYIGDTMVDFVNMYGARAYRRYYCYEIVPESVIHIKRNIELLGLENVVVRPVGAGRESGFMHVSAVTVPSTSKLGESGGEGVPVVAIDDDIHEPVTLIKMDIEGGEQQALLGCQRKIRESHPKLALSAYHSLEDLWKLARIVYAIDPTYKFYLRYYGNALLPTEYLLYGL